MNEVMRETLGSVWRLCDQMSYAAENGMVATLRAEYDSLKRLMARLEVIQEHIGKEA